MEFHLTATECHLPYGITQCYLLPDTSEHNPLVEFNELKRITRQFKVIDVCRKLEL